MYPDAGSSPKLTNAMLVKRCVECGHAKPFCLSVPSLYKTLYSIFFLKEEETKASEMVQWVKVPVARPGNLTSISGTQMVT